MNSHGFDQVFIPAETASATRSAPQPVPASPPSPFGQRTEPQSAFATLSITLPKGCDVAPWFSEMFSTNPTTDPGSLTIPIPVRPGRSGFGLQPTLSYDSGASHGPLGMNWRPGLPSIEAQTVRLGSTDSAENSPRGADGDVSEDPLNRAFMRPSVSTETRERESV